MVVSRSLLLIFLALFAGSAIFYGFFNSWLEQQRVFQLLLMVVAVGVLLFHRGVSLPRGIVQMAVCLLCFGLLSSALADYPAWALREWAKVTGSFVLVLVVARLSASYKWQVVILAVMGVVTTILAYQFLLFYLMAFISGIYNLSPFVLYAGFDNPRFYSQAMILFLPVLAWIYGLLCARRMVGLAALVFGVCAVQWALLIALGGRGSWFAVLIANLGLWFLGPRFRSEVYRQACAVLVGLILYLAMFFLVPSVFGMQSDSLQGFRGGLSGRDLIWGKALQMAASHPWLGVGPMHFSADWNHIAAHPHQAILQWAAEWGIPSALCVFFLLALGMWKGLMYVRSSPNATGLDAVLWVSLASGILLAQVDGVFVMPYAEGWMAIIAGLAIARWCSGEKIDGSPALKLLALTAGVICLYVVLCDVPRLYEAQNAFWAAEKIGSPPRFWDQGWIPMKIPLE